MSVIGIGVLALLGLAMVIAIGTITLLVVLGTKIVRALLTKDATGSHRPVLVAVLGVLGILLAVGLVLPAVMTMLSFAAPTHVVRDSFEVGVHAIDTWPAGGPGMWRHAPRWHATGGDFSWARLAFLGGFLLIVWLLARKKTRSIATGILLVCVAVTLVGGWTLFRTSHYRRAMMVPRQADGQLAYVDGMHRFGQAIDTTRDRIGQGSGKVAWHRAKTDQALASAAATVAGKAGPTKSKPSAVATSAHAGSQSAGTLTASPASGPATKDQAEAKATPAASGFVSSASKAKDQATSKAAPGVAAKRVATAETATGKTKATAKAGDQTERAAERPQQRPPDWVRVPPKRVGNGYQRTAVSDPFSSDKECRRQLDEKTMLVTGEYLDELLGTMGTPASYRQRLKRMGITPAYIRKKICQDEFVEYVDSSVDEIAQAGFGPMRRIHVLMVFDEGVQRDLKRRWKEAVLGERLAAAGLVAAIMLLLIGVVYAYLRVDTATRGFYTRRLQVTAGLVTMLVVAAVAALIIAG